MVYWVFLSLLLKALAPRIDDFRFLNKMLTIFETLKEWSIFILVELMIIVFLTYCWCNFSLISKVTILVFQRFFQVLKVLNIFCLLKGHIIKQYMSNVCFKLKIFLYKNYILNLWNYEAASGTRLLLLSAVLHAD